MTRHTRRSTLRKHLYTWVIPASGIGALLLMLMHADTAAACVRQSLALCTKTVIPSLFPFMVLSELLVACGGGELLGRLCERPLRRMLGISGASVCALMTGLVCGFPVGTKTAAALCRRGLISPQELSRLICFCNIPGAAFLVHAVGASLFGSRRMGLMLLAVCLLSAWGTALLLHRLAPLPATREAARPPAAPLGCIQALTRAITGAVGAMLCVCAYILFFGATVGTLTALLQARGLGRTGAAVLFGLFELSGGAARAAAMEHRLLAQVLVAAMCGWSGLCVQLQILSLCDDLPHGGHVSVRLFVMCRLLQGVLCGGLFFVLSHLFPQDAATASPAIALLHMPSFVAQSIAEFLNGAFVFCAIFCVFRLIYPLFRKKHV